MKHNPGFLSADDLIESFIVRQAELESLLETLRQNTTTSNQHVLVIGRRGMGKTMLVHRFAAAIERDPELASHWFPILFGEETYNASSAGELWLEALHQLATHTGEARWHAAHVELRRERDQRRLHDRALARLLDFADERGVRLLIAVENLQDILGPQMREDEGWVLRHTLLNEPRIMLLATATRRFNDIDLPKKATYELFATLELRPLTRVEIREIWARLTGQRFDDASIRPIEIFTGGNPRLLTILAGFARGQPFKDFMDDLLGLVDDHSDYFKSNIEALPVDERRAFTALCELWEPSIARAVAEVARFDVNKTSMLLGRLVDRGAANVARTRGRTRYYQVCERLYNLFHRLRRSPTRDNRAASVVEFMAHFYASEQLPDIAVRIAGEACRVPEAREEQLLVLHHLFERGAIPRKAAFERFSDEFWQIPEIRRQELHWLPWWEIRRATQIGEWLEDESAQVPPLDDDDVDTPIIRGCIRLREDKAFAVEFLDVLLGSIGKASNVAISFGVFDFVAVAGIDEVERLTRRIGRDNPGMSNSDFLIGAAASRRWQDVHFRRLAEARLEAALNGDFAIEAARVLFDSHEAAGEIDAAIAIAERANSIAPSPDIHCDIARLSASRDPVRAETEYRTALALSPLEPRAALALVQLLLSLARAAEAERFARDWLASRPRDIAALTANCLVVMSDDSERGLSLLRSMVAEFFAEPEPFVIDLPAVDQWITSLVIALRTVEESKAIEIARSMHRRIVAQAGSIQDAAVEVVTNILAVSQHREVLQIALECEARLSTKRPQPRQVKFALTMHGAQRALEVLADVARENPDALPELLSVYRKTLMELAFAEPAGLHAIASTIPLFEPLAVALAQELGSDVLAPYEVEEVAKDIRAELRKLRGPVDAVDVPVLAAAEDARPRRVEALTPRKSRRKQPR